MVVPFPAMVEAEAAEGVHPPVVLVVVVVEARKRPDLMAVSTMEVAEVAVEAGPPKGPPHPPSSLEERMAAAAAAEPLAVSLRTTASSIAVRRETKRCPVRWRWSRLPPNFHS